MILHRLSKRLKQFSHAGLLKERQEKFLITLRFLLSRFFNHFFRFSLSARIKCFFQSRSIHPTVIINNMRIYISYHLDLCMTGIALHRLHIATIQLQLISDTGMTEGMENHLWKPMFLD